MKGFITGAQPPRETHSHFKCNGVDGGQNNYPRVRCMALQDAIGALDKFLSLGIIQGSYRWLHF